MPPTTQDFTEVAPILATPIPLTPVSIGTSSLDAFNAETIPDWKDLYSLFARGIRFYLCRQLGPQELDDKVHDAFLIVGASHQARGLAGT